MAGVKQREESVTINWVWWAILHQLQESKIYAEVFWGVSLAVNPIPEGREVVGTGPSPRSSEGGTSTAPHGGSRTFCLESTHAEESGGQRLCRTGGGGG